MGSFCQNPAVCAPFSEQDLLGLPCLPRLTKSHTRPAAIFIDEFDAGGFKGMPQRSFLRRRHGNFPINDLYSADRRDAYPQRAAARPACQPPSIEAVFRFNQQLSGECRLS